MGPAALPWQFVLGVGMACAVTALPILILLMEKLEILRQPLGQRILRYASLDDIAIWGVLALILMDWERVGRQGIFLLAFALAACGIPPLMVRLPERDRWYVGLIWLAACALRRRLVRACTSWSAPSWPAWCMDADWFDQEQDGPAAPPRAAGGDAGVLPQHRAAHQLGDGRRGGVRGGGGAAGGLGGGQAGRHAPGRPHPEVAAGRGLA